MKTVKTYKKYYKYPDNGSGFVCSKGIDELT